MTIQELKRDLKQELEEEKKDILKDKYPKDRIREMVDSFIPIYHSDLLEVAQSDLWLAVEEPEIMAFDGKNTAVNAIAGNIYDELIEVAMDWLNSHE